MSAINLYTTKEEALYFKDSQRNSFYEFGGIQLIPNNTYTQKVTNVELGNGYDISILKVSDDSVIGGLLYVLDELPNTNTIYAASNIIYAASNTIRTDSFSDSIFYISITPTVDYQNELIYLKITDNSIINITISNFKSRVSTAGGTFEAEEQLRSYLLTLIDANDYTYYYSNPFYITALDEDRTTKFTYKDLASNQYQSIGLKTWFRQKSRQSELTTYYESSTKNTVTQAIKTHNLEMYESEFMSIDDLIMTAEILESPYLYIGNTRYSLFEAFKIPELTQQENFGKIKFTLAPNN
jgi:hypothetical protein